MSRITGTNNRQSAFLRAFRSNPAGPPPDLWPSPAIFRRWLRSPGFRAALESIQATLRTQTDLLIASQAAHAARGISAPDAPAHSAHRVSELLRIGHLRSRFSKDPAKPVTKTASLPPRYRDPATLVTEEQIAAVARKRNYQPPLEKWPDFPDPVPQDTFYYKLLQQPYVLLVYLRRYQDRFKDYRYSPILASCRHLIRGDDSALPHFASDRPRHLATSRAT